MSTRTSRTTAMKAIIAGSVVPAHDSGVIQREFDEVERVRRIRVLKRRHLLQVLHSTRALDSFLSAFALYHGCRGRSKSLGGYLNALERHRSSNISQLPSGTASYYQGTIVNKRNLYMHEAGAFPASSTEINTLLSEMHNLIVTIAGL